jgi:hypothetical protein
MILPLSITREDKIKDANQAEPHLLTGKQNLTTASERQNQDLSKLMLTADQINMHLLQCIAQIDQFICIYKSKLL